MISARMNKTIHTIKYCCSVWIWRYLYWKSMLMLEWSRASVKQALISSIFTLSVLHLVLKREIWGLSTSCHERLIYTRHLNNRIVFSSFCCIFIKTPDILMQQTPRISCMCSFCFHIKKKEKRKLATLSKHNATAAPADSSEDDWADETTRKLILFPQNAGCFIIQILINVQLRVSKHSLSYQDIFFALFNICMGHNYTYGWFKKQQ